MQKFESDMLPLLAAYVQVARLRSFTKAAAQLGVTRAAVSQNVRSLEQRLGVQLLYRTTRDMSLTETGQQLLDTIAPAVQTIAGALDAIYDAGEEPSGLIRINTSRMASQWLLEPHLPAFLQQHPRVAVEIIMDDGMANIIADGTDMGIRMGKALAEHVVAIPIVRTLRMAIVGSPAYLSAHGVPQHPSDLRQHNCLGYRLTSSGIVEPWSFSTPDSDQFFQVTEPGNFVTNDGESLLRAALAGVGLVQHMDLAVHAFLEEGSLVQVLQPWCQPFPGFYLYVPSNKHIPAKTRALLDFLKRQHGLM